MTNKDVLIMVKQERDSYKRKIEEGFTFYQDIMEYYDIIVEALEKQIPKKTYKHEEDYYVCPNCDCQITWRWFESYCEHCGQAIYRSDEE